MPSGRASCSAGKHKYQSTANLGRVLACRTASCADARGDYLGACRYNPIKTIKTSFIGTMNMLGLAKRTKARVLLTSTSEVYGDPLQHPQTEEYWGNVNCIGERSCYDEGKRAAECLTMDYHREHGLEVGDGCKGGLEVGDGASGVPAWW